MEIGLGVYTGECMDSEGVTPTEVLRDSLTQAQLAEQVGLDAMWISEHHFLPNGYVGSVLPFAAAMGAVTSRIGIGVSVALAPLYDPVRLAEDAAFVDLLTGGRFQLGVALGYRDVEYEGFETTRRDRVGRTEELCQLLRQCWGSGSLDFDGRHFRRRGVEVHPKPAQPSGVPLLMGGHAPRAIDRVARLADGFIMDGGTDSDVFAEQGHNRDIFDRVETAFGMYREALARHGRPSERPRFYLTLGGFLADGGPDSAWGLVQDAYMYTRRVYGDWYGLAPEEYERWYPALMPPQEHARRRTEIWLGGPDDLIPRFERLRDITGDSIHVMFRCKYPGVPDGATRRSIELLGKVRDHFRG
jgi:alkanesulfonate monooxygenase SsuD/methylene tetrahydromethanopterin reductase-like flavin-dependent oxidoreductase (luciferase family)